MIEKEKVILLKPQTYMNLSGNSVKEVVDFYKIEKEKILVIYDDMDIEPGKIKIRKKHLADIQFAQKTKTKIMKYREDNDSVLLFYEKRI